MKDMKHKCFDNMILEISFVVKGKVFGIVEFKPIEVKLQINYCYIYF